MLIKIETTLYTFFKFVDTDSLIIDGISINIDIYLDNDSTLPLFLQYIVDV